MPPNPPQSLPRAPLTQAGAADEGGGGERPGGGTVDLPGVGDEEGGMLLQAAGHPDVVHPQEAAAGEGDIPGGVRGEHGLRHGMGRDGTGWGGDPLTAPPPPSGRAGGREAGDEGRIKAAETLWVATGRPGPAVAVLWGAPCRRPAPLRGRAEGRRCRLPSAGSNGRAGGGSASQPFLP